MMIKNQFKNIYALCGGLLVFFIIFFRFIRKRAFGPIDFTFSYTKAITYFFSICIFSLTLILVIALPFYNKYLKKVIANPEEFIKSETRFFTLQKKALKLELRFKSFIIKYWMNFSFIFIKSLKANFLIFLLKKQE